MANITENNYTSENEFGLRNGYTLWILNKAELQYNYPAIIFIVCLFIIGMVGNCLVIYVYHVMLKKTTAHYFIKILAILDVTCCLFGMTFEITDLSFPLLNGEPVSCKAFRTIEQTVELSSGMVLLLISYDRYVHICHPFRTFTARQARKMVYLALVLSIFICSPSLYIYGTAEVVVKEVTARVCSYDDVIKDSPLRYAYNMLLLAISLMLMFPMVYCYTKIGIAVTLWQRKAFRELNSDRRRESNVVSSTSFSTHLEQFDAASDSKHPKQINNCLNEHHGSNTDDFLPHRTDLMHIHEGRRTSYSNTDDGNQIYQQLRRNLKRRKKTKMIIMLFLVTVVFVLSYIPYFTMVILYSTSYVDKNTFSTIQKQWWEVAYRSYFLSNALNPLIYASLDDKFRKSCKWILLRIDGRQETT